MSYDPVLLKYPLGSGRDPALWCPFCELAAPVDFAGLAGHLAAYHSDRGFTRWSTICPCGVHRHINWRSLESHLRDVCEISPDGPNTALRRHFAIAALAGRDSVLD